jgi:hypothetical protein
VGGGFKMAQARRLVSFEVDKGYNGDSFVRNLIYVRIKYKLDRQKYQRRFIWAVSIEALRDIPAHNFIASDMYSAFKQRFNIKHT